MGFPLFLQSREKQGRSLCAKSLWYDSSEAIVLVFLLYITVLEKEWKGLVYMGEYDNKFFLWKHNRDFHIIFLFKTISVKLEEKDRKKNIPTWKRFQKVLLRKSSQGKGGGIAQVLAFICAKSSYNSWQIASATLCILSKHCCIEDTQLSS